jgi:ABC-2 type transport system permease protein
MNIIKRELKANLKSYIIWIVSLALLFYAASTEYSVFAENEQVADALNNPTFQLMFQALGVEDINIITPEGYLSLMSFYIYLPLSIFAAIIGSGIISKEERDKTAEYVFTLPVTRRKVLFSKLVVSIFYTLTMTIGLLLFCYWAFGRIASSDNFAPFIFNLTIGVFLTQMIFLSIGLLLSSVLKQYKKSGSITLGVLISTFMISMLTQITDKVDFLKYFTPFQYFNVNNMLAAEYPMEFLILTFVIVTGCISGLFYFYNKRDLYI